LRQRIQAAWGATLCELMGGTDLAVIYWGECDHQSGMHMTAPDSIITELIDPDSGQVKPFSEGATGELVYTAIQRQASPVLRFRSGDHVVVTGMHCRCGRRQPQIRCFGRTDDMLIVRGVNVFPSALREVVSQFRPDVSGVISIRPTARGVKQSPPLPVIVELSEGIAASTDLADKIRQRIRDVLVVGTEIKLVPWGTLPRSDYKSKLVDWTEATD
jgi:phenylacetate-CoA ligase